jgi:selenocysteine lyase/cysteine desulfurase
MPAAARWAYFDHAAVAPLTAPARQALADWAGDSADNGVTCWPAWQRRIEQARQSFGALLHADPLDIAFVPNTTAGIGLVAEGLRWRDGDNVVTAEEEYPSNLYPWMNLAERGVELRRVPSRGGRIEIDDLAAAIDPRTRLVTLSWVEYASGFRNDLDAVGALCRERGVLFLVDAIQGLGVLPLDLSRTPVDFLSADGHKWLLGPEGAGVFYARRERLEELHPIGVGWNSVVGAHDFAAIDFRLEPHAGRWEGGTLNAGSIAALGASLALLLELGGPAALEPRILDLTDRLCAGARRVGWGVHGRVRERDRSGIVSLAAPAGVQPAAVVRQARAAGIVLNARGGRVRASPHAYNSEDEVDRLVNFLGGLA